MQFDGFSIRRTATRTHYRLLGVLTLSAVVSLVAVLSPAANSIASNSGSSAFTSDAAAAETGPAATPRAAPVYGYEVLKEYPHDPHAFTEGLVYVDDELFEGTGMYGESALRKVDLESGAPLLEHVVGPQHFGEGIAVLDHRIYQLTWETGTCFVYDRKTFREIETFRYETEGWGLTTDGTALYMSDGTNRITIRDPLTFETIESIEVHDGDRPIDLLNELEYINGEIWANVYYSDFIARIDPETGIVNSWIDLTGLLEASPEAEPQPNVLNGIAYDASTGRIFVTGKYWPTLFEIEVVKRA
jgi:glutaminyl-peptide cyclotransferase